MSRALLEEGNVIFGDVLPNIDPSRRLSLSLKREV